MFEMLEHWEKRLGDNFLERDDVYLYDWMRDHFNNLKKLREEFANEWVENPEDCFVDELYFDEDEG